MKPEDVEKRKPGPKIKFHDERHKKMREVAMRHYWRKKYEKEREQNEKED